MIARALYASVFCLAVPVLLAWWAIRLDASIHLPVVHVPGIGVALSLAGLVLMLWSMWALWRIGGGLPMNAFPPRRRVERGPFALVGHPIYLGFVIACAGVSIWAGSPAGFWIITPVAALGCTALVLGYERDAVERRFGPASNRPLLSLPPADEARVRWRDVAAVWGIVLIPWLIVYEAVGHLPVPGAVDVMSSWERRWPVLPWTEVVYASVYPITILAPVIAGTRANVRRFAEAGLVAMVLATVCYLSVPAISPPRPVVGEGLLADLLRWERADGLDGRAAYPAFHVAWALIAAGTVWRRIRGARPRILGAVPWAWASALAASCITTGMHALADIITGVLLWIVAWWWRPILGVIRIWCERLANSWREWRIGPVRLISHAMFAGLAAAVGGAIVTGLVGPANVPMVLIVAAAALIGAGLWGQVFVKRPTSSRPFGYFGCVLGATGGIGAVLLCGVDAWPLAAAFAVAAPWVQAVGRLRCLVQGCCHGRPTSSFIGIRYTHPRSRVCRAAGLGGQSVHPTPLYSTLGNVAIGLLLVRLWEVRASTAFIAGSYLILAGLLRFIEEHYRGEPHTPIVGGLRIYQWFSVVSVLAGIAVSAVSARPPATPWTWSPTSLAASLGIAIVFALVMGVDFPESNRRFARLA